ncbi:MAG TPA: class I SAM-dependent rRNA methyltransferase [Syntrophales bacterium]|jgi:23S rRNA (cytosine1962-C5)-methyltransferase|nr:class I SAM-dependent rRNA methyltransferase [Syntrophales bacterium]HOT48627.1 class I SAM-dependent rRNA methyltransferase [Syntrophales bacterium]
MKSIAVNRSAADRLRAFHPWVYRTDIQAAEGDPGELVSVHAPGGAFLGIGYYNPASEIGIRILSFSRTEINRDFFRERLLTAFRKREFLAGTTDACRLVHAEADDLPGLVVDDYAGHLVLQLNTLGWEPLRNLLLEELLELRQPKGIYEKSDAASRRREGLATVDGVLHGEIPGRIEIEEAGARFLVNVREGQKTGFFLDQRRNRETVSSYVEAGFDVLDVFAHTGAFGIRAGLRGAGRVRLVDISREALALARENMAANGVSGETVRADAFDYLADAPGTRDRYDLVILDPPPFARVRKNADGALKGLRHLIAQSLRILRPGGLLAAFSCSHHVSQDGLRLALLEAAADRGCRIEILEHFFQDRDHPQILNVPMSLYLKGFLVRPL